MASTQEGAHCSSNSEDIGMVLAAATKWRILAAEEVLLPAWTWASLAGGGLDFVGRAMFPLRRPLPLRACMRWLLARRRGAQQ